MSTFVEESIPPTSRLVGLHDLRESSPTCGSSMRFVLGLTLTADVDPPGGYGVANFTQQTQSMIHLVNQHFSLDDADERRRVWDAFGADFWEMTRG